MNDYIEDVVLKLFEKPGVYTDLVMYTERDKVGSTGTEMTIVRETGVQYIIQKPLPYNIFLKRIASTTNLPIKSYILLYVNLLEYTGQNLLLILMKFCCKLLF